VKVKLIEAAWQSYQEKIIPPGAPRIQVVECKRAFYAGAGSLLDSLLKVIGPGKEPTESDMMIMEGVQEEFDEFIRETQSENG